ncbi:MAG: hypothetical protein HY328_15065 [Chloroflexi bacterium]|nr:hypothetical protein [Chloroflexota bacterium]
MNFYTIIWPEDRVDHIARHNVTPDEFDEVCFGQSLALRVKAYGANPVFQVLGQTESGYYLFCVVIAMPDGTGYPVTARPMTLKEVRRYKQWRRR